MFALDKAPKKPISLNCGDSKDMEQFGWKTLVQNKTTTSIFIVAGLCAMAKTTSTTT